MKSLLVIVLPIFSMFASFPLLASDDNLTDPIMVDGSNGWRQKITNDDSFILRTNDGGKHWIDVSPPSLGDAVKKYRHEQMADFLEDAVQISPLDARRAWVSIVPPNLNETWLADTRDAGRHWTKKIAPIDDDSSAPISFVDEAHGFLLALGDPAAGLMKKHVYGTEDGGNRWYVLTPPPAEGCYPTGISFRSHSDGWIGGTYHGGDAAPLYRTVDGGKSWKLQQIPIPADYQGGYANVEPPVFTGPDKKKGYLPVHLVRHTPPPDHDADVKYETDDGGATWHLPASGVQSNLLK